MELGYMDRRNGLHEDAIPEFSGRTEENQDPTVAASDVQSDLGQINRKKPLLSDEKKSKSCQSCHKSLVRAVVTQITQICSLHFLPR